MYYSIGPKLEKKYTSVKQFHIFITTPLMYIHFYYQVDEVRTADDALIRVKLMIFYELKDIELMVSECAKTNEMLHEKKKNNSSSGFSTRSDTNHPVQQQKKAISVKFQEIVSSM